MTTIAALADLALSLEASPDADEAAARCILDLVIASVVGCGGLPPVAARILHGDGVSAIWFSGQTAAPIGAAFVNSLAAAALDLDDGNRLARGHPGAAVIPAVFAEADRRDVSDRAILKAIIVGYEVGVRVAAARGFYARTGAWCGYGVAAALAVLRGIAGPTLAHALAIAGTTAPHMQATLGGSLYPPPEGNDVKEGIPWGTATGMAAVDLAEAGLTGPRDMLDHAPFFDGTAILAAAGRPAICNTYFKPYAGCRHIHAPIDALLGLMAAHAITAEEIGHVAVHVYDGALRLSNLADPANLVDVQYSIPYCLGLAALRGRDALVPLQPDCLDDAAVSAFAHRVSLHHDPEMTARFPAETPVRVVVGVGDRRLTSPVMTPRGDPSEPLSWDDLIDKFTTATRHRLDDRARRRLMETFAALRDGAVAPLRQALRAATRFAAADSTERRPPGWHCGSTPI